ncbi:type II toxin-antitoxin system PemK/MazF family toxin [Desulfococcaceae bacterium HSG9]|nr:type II toxin-antitoxin system PemK/MazF family toxin [Desulfococcaceae bacterium HSG9]
MVIRKGAIYWVDFSSGKGSEPKGRRPGLVIQNDVLNDSKLNTVIILAITSALKFENYIISYYPIINHTATWRIY